MFITLIHVFHLLPWTDENPDRGTSYLNKPIPDGLIEVKEWEVLKSIDEAEKASA